ncbi:putative retinal-specific ATP-binding cassette transporter-like [Sesbania bispinosa]|nr:putative retinal-specific ATP-binding cassette transporter-like [Sesbania bispinosa]
MAFPFLSLAGTIPSHPQPSPKTQNYPTTPLIHVLDQPLPSPPSFLWAIAIAPR